MNYKLLYDISPPLLGIKPLFQNLKLLTKEGELTRAAILLFGKEPTRFFSCATFKIGRFRGSNPTDLIIQDKVWEVIN